MEGYKRNLKMKKKQKIQRDYFLDSIKHDKQGWCMEIPYLEEKDMCKHTTLDKNGARCLSSWIRVLFVYDKIIHEFMEKVVNLIKEEHPVIYKKCLGKYEKCMFNLNKSNIICNIIIVEFNDHRKITRKESANVFNRVAKSFGYTKDCYIK